MKKTVILVVVLLLVLVAAPWGIGRLAEKRVNAGLDRLVVEAPYLTIVDRKWTPGWFRSEQEVTFEVFGDLMDLAAAAAAASATSTGPEAANPEGDESIAQLASADPAEAPVEEAAPDGAATEDAAPAEVAPDEGAAPAEGSMTADVSLRFTVRNEILHGPVLWPASLGIARVNTKLVLDEKERAKLVEIFGTDEPVRISTRVRFFGGGTTRFLSDGRTIEFKDGSGKLDYDDLKMYVGYGRNLNSVDFDGSWPRLEYTGKDGKAFRMRGMEMSGDGKRVLGELFDSDFTFKIGEMAFTDAQSAQTSVADIHYIVDSKLDDDFMDMGAKLGSGKVSNPQLKQIGLELDEVHYDFTLRHLHAATLDKLIVAMRDMYKKPMTDAAAIDAAFVTPFKEHGIELLRHDPELALDRIGIVTPEGEGIIKGVIRLKGVTQEDFAAGAMSMIGKIDADITVEVAQKLVEKIPNGATGAGMAVDQGYAKRDGDKIVSRIEFKQGELKINGKAQGIPGMGGPPPQEMPPEEGGEAAEAAPE